MEMQEFKNMPYERPDMDALKAAYTQAIDQMKNARAYADARAAFFALQAAETRWDQFRGEGGGPACLAAQ